MTVAAPTATLRTLHRIHRQLDDLGGQLAAGPRLVAANAARVAAAEAKRTAAQDEVKKARMSADQKQLQLKSAEAKIRDLEGKRNACKTNREYQTLGEQIAADTMATKVLEDEILEVLERLDSLKAAVPAAEAEVATTGKALAEAQAKVAAEAGRLEAEVARVRAELDAVERGLEGDVREKYERVVKHKGADGLAPLDGRSCGGCCQQVTSDMVAAIGLGRVVVCRGCGRLLYHPETPTPS
ncbi:MAG: zinc ribbon domain-containing protein [Planctomycetaceae bacterium]